MKLKESLKSYFSDPTVKGAVDSVLDNKFSIPEDLDWPDLPGFHNAVLAAYQVRCDFACFLIETWEATWQPAIMDCDFRRDELTPFTFKDLSKERILKSFSPENVWKNRWIERRFKIELGNSFQLQLGIELFEETTPDLHLYFYLWEQEREYVTENLKLEESEWQPLSDYEGYFGTPKYHTPLQVDGTTNLERSKQVANNALKAVHEYFIENT